VVFGVGADGSGTSANDPTKPNLGEVDDEGNLVSEGPNFPGAGTAPEGYPESAQVQWNTNDSAVPWNYELDLVGTADRPIGYRPTGEMVNRPFYQAVNYANMLRGRANSPTATQADKDRYKGFVNDLRRYTGSKVGTVGSVEAAWRTVLSDAQEGNTPALLLLQSTGGVDGDGGSTTRGGSSAYTGPRESITVQAESDIRATANALALEMIGRPLNDKEIERVTKRMRKAEQEQPQVTTGSAARTVTTQGLTAQGREDVLRDVIAKRPEFEQYQLDTTVMDAMNAYVQEKRQVVDV
jgi:hypothetical protein